MKKILDIINRIDGDISNANNAFEATVGIIVLIATVLLLLAGMCLLLMIVGIIAAFAFVYWKFSVPALLLWIGYSFYRVSKD